LVHVSVRAAATGEDGPADVLTVTPADPQTTPRAPVSPAIIALVGLAIGISYIVAVALDRQLANDLFWQLAAGQWMVTHHAVMGLDPFSYTESHHRWISDEWGSEVALAELYRAFGPAAYNVMSIATGSLSLVLCTLYARTLGARGGRLAGIAILLSLGLANFVAEDRGLSFSLIWLPLELLVLNKARTNPRWLGALPLLCLLWVNTHGSILVGLAVIGVELAWALAPSHLVQRLGGQGRSPFPGLVALAGAGSVLASCLTPYGPKLLAYDISVAHNSEIARYISEWNSPDFRSVVALLTFCIPLAVFVMALRKGQVMLLEATLVAGFFVGALLAQRIEIYLMVATAGLAASVPARRIWGPTARRWAGAGLIGLMVAIVAIPSVPAGTVSPSVPVQAFNFLATHPGRVFTEYTWGDYSIARHRATFADGRTDLFTGPVLTEFFAITELSVDPDPILSRYDVDYVVWAPDTPLSEFLSRDPRWQVVDHAGPALVFARRSVWATAASATTT
jgi:hypothetical protein